MNGTRKIWNDKVGELDPEELLHQSFEESGN